MRSSESDERRKKNIREIKKKEERERERERENKKKIAKENREVNMNNEIRKKNILKKKTGVMITITMMMKAIIHSCCPFPHIPFLSTLFLFLSLSLLQYLKHWTA